MNKWMIWGGKLSTPILGSTPKYPTAVAPWFTLESHGLTASWLHGAPKNGWLEDFFVSFWGPAYFQVRLLLVLGSVTCQQPWPFFLKMLRSWESFCCCISKSKKPQRKIWRIEVWRIYINQKPQKFSTRIRHPHLPFITTGVQATFFWHFMTLDIFQESAGIALINISPQKKCFEKINDQFVFSPG